MSALSGRFRALLLLSLALNLALSAALLMCHWQPFRDHDHADRRWARVPDPRALAHALDDADRQILQQVLERHRAALVEQFRPLGQARRQLAEALRSEPFDPARMDAAYAQMRAAEGGGADAMHAFMRDLAPQISAAGRVRIAEHLERGRGGRRERTEAAPAAPPAG
ncbi:MAG: periplasmic heavy metal sensor [Lysobacterales bacterium]